jgi:histidinol-phosphate/aromatic aminotransferase/cobyric acid decarboxylase-like protein
MRLDGNENAYGPSERAKAAMRESLGVADRVADGVTP